MKKIILSLVVFLMISACNEAKHYHDGKYKSKIEVFGFNFASISYTINGNEIIIDNSISGITKLECKQYDDRIEYTEENGTTRILYALENGDLQFNDDISLEKVN